MEPVSKTGVPFAGTVGSNPALSVGFLRGFVSAYECVTWESVFEKWGPDCPRTVLFSDFSQLKLKLFIALCACLSFIVKYISKMALEEWPIHSRMYL